MINDHDLLLVILEKLAQIKQFRVKNFNCSREEFSCNDLYIKLGLGIIEKITNITNKIDALTILNSEYLVKEIPLLNRYKQSLFNPDNTVNAYKLYDFLNNEVDALETGIKDLVNR